MVQYITIPAMTLHFHKRNSRLGIFFEDLSQPSGLRGCYHLLQLRSLFLLSPQPSSRECPGHGHISRGHLSVLADTTQGCTEWQPVGLQGHLLGKPSRWRCSTSLFLLSIPLYLSGSCSLGEAFWAFTFSSQQSNKGLIIAYFCTNLHH